MASSLLDLYNIGRPELEGGWSQSPDLIDRMTMLPIGQYEDGGVLKDMGQYGYPAALALANSFINGPRIGEKLGDLWDAGVHMATGMRDSAVRSAVAQEGPPIFDDGGQYVSGAYAEPLDAFNAASIAPMAGVGMRAAGMATERAAPRLAQETAAAHPSGIKLSGGQAGSFSPDGGPDQWHRFYYDMMDEANQPAGYASGWVDGDTMHVQWMGDDDLTNALGVRGIRQLREQVRKDFPQVKHFTGDRISGARGESGAQQFVTMNANDSRSSLPAIVTQGNGPLLLQGQEDDPGLMQFANADPAYDADALVWERWKNLPFVQGDPSAYNAGHVDPFQIQQQMMIDPLEHWFRPQPSDPPPLFR